MCLSGQHFSNTPKWPQFVCDYFRSRRLGMNKQFLTTTIDIIGWAGLSYAKSTRI